MNTSLILSSIYHRATENYAYPIAQNRVILNVRAAKKGIKSIEVCHNDVYCTLKSGNRYKDYSFKIKDKMHIQYELAHTNIYSVEVQAPFHRLKYVFKITLENGEIHYLFENGILDGERFDTGAIGGFQAFLNPYNHKTSVVEPVKWVGDTVWYQIFPERFNRGNMNPKSRETLEWDSVPPKNDIFFGGDLAGITEKLDYLKQLGISGLYFTPIFWSDTSHKYDTIDYYKLDPDFGTEEELKELITQAHKRGIRVMLDAVFNHSGSQWGRWKDVIEKGEESEFVEWFHIKSFPIEVCKGLDIGNCTYKDYTRYVESKVVAGEFPEIHSYETFAHSSNMPKLNTENKAVQDYLIDVATYWIREFDIDGWRLDVANEVCHEFWRRFRKETKALKDDFYVLGEIWGDSIKWLEGDEFDGVMNYPMTVNLVRVLADKNFSNMELMYNVNKCLANYKAPTNAMQFNLIDSHDTTRLMTQLKNDKELFKTAILFVMTTVGSPCIYYGTEIGLEGEFDPDNRRCMPWNELEKRADMLESIRSYIALRNELQTLRAEGELHFRADIMEENPSVIAYERVNKEERILVVMNYGKEEYVLKFDISKIYLQEHIQIKGREIMLKPNAKGVFSI